MPRVERKKKIRLGADRECGRCHSPIEPGDEYLQWSFRYGGTHYRCVRPECRPRQSELTQSKMSEVYAAIEEAEDGIRSADDIEGIRADIEMVAERVGEIAQEYEDAAEPFGNQGENQERAEELQGWEGELENFYPDEEDDDLDNVRLEAEELLGTCPI